MQKSKMNAFPNEAMWRDAIYKLLKHIETCFTHTQTHQTHPHPPQRKTSKHIQAILYVGTHAELSKLYIVNLGTPSFT